MAWKHCTANYLLFPTYFGLDDERELLRFLGRRHDLDFGEYSPRGGGTTVAHLRWTSETEVLFEGVGTPEHRLSIDVSPERVAAHWKGFCDTVRAHCEREDAERRAAAKPLAPAGA